MACAKAAGAKRATSERAAVDWRMKRFMACEVKCTGRRGIE